MATATLVAMLNELRHEQKARHEAEAIEVNDTTKKVNLYLPDLLH